MTPTVSTFFHSIMDIVLDPLCTGWMEQNVISRPSEFAHIDPNVKNDDLVKSLKKS